MIHFIVQRLSLLALFVSTGNDLPCRAQELVIHAHTAGTWDAAFSPDGKQIATCGNRPLRSAFGIESRANIGEVKIWNSTTGELVKELPGLTDSMLRLAYSPDRKYLVAGSCGDLKDPKDFAVYVWELGQLEMQRTFSIPGRCTAIEVSDDSKMLAAGIGKGRNGVIAIVWDLATGIEISVIRAPQNTNSQSVGISLAPDGKSLATIRLLLGKQISHVIERWDPSTGKLINTIAEASDLHCVAYSPDGKLLAVGQKQGDVALFDPATGKEVRVLDELVGFDITRLAFSPNGRLLACAELLDVRIWNTAAAVRKTKSVVLRGHKAVVNAIAFSPDGKRVASASLDETVRVYDVDRVLKQN